MQAQITQKHTKFLAATNTFNITLIQIQRKVPILSQVDADDMREDPSDNDDDNDVHPNRPKKRKANQEGKQKKKCQRSSTEPRNFKPWEKYVWPFPCKIATPTSFINAQILCDKS